MPWFTTPVTIYVNTEAETLEDARSHAETTVEKRVCGAEFGFDDNDRSIVLEEYEMGETESSDDDEDAGESVQDDEGGSDNER